MIFVLLGSSNDFFLNHALIDMVSSFWFFDFLIGSFSTSGMPKSCLISCEKEITSITHIDSSNSSFLNLRQVLVAFALGVWD